MSLAAPAVVYALCLLAGLACTGLLVRAWTQSRARLLFWAALSFAFLTANNLFLILDTVVFPDVPLLWARQGSQLAAVSVLLYGFIWESQ